MDKLNHLPDEARIWIHGFPQVLSRKDKTLIQEKLSNFIPGWVSHGVPVQSAFTILQDRFLVTAAHCAGGISGCSTDSFIRNLKELSRDHSLDGLQGSLVFYRDTDQAIQTAQHLDFFDLVDSGQIDTATVVFDTLLQSLGELRAGRFEIRFGESWHARTYPLLTGS